MGSGRNSNSSKLLWLSLLPVRMIKIYTKMKALGCSHFSNYKSIDDISRRSRAANYAVLSSILLNFEPVRDFMVVRVKNEEDPIKN